MIKTDDFLINPTKMLSSTIKTGARIDAPEIPLINHILNISLTDFTDEIDPNNNSEILRQFDSVKKSIDTLKKSEPLSDKVSYHDVHHYAVIYVLIVGLFLAAVTFYWRRRRRQAQRQETSKLNL